MKVLKIIERIFVWVATVLALASIVVSSLADEAVGLLGMLTSLTRFFPLGAGVGLALLLIGVLIRDNKNEVAAKVGNALTIVTFICLFAAAFFCSPNSTSYVLGIVGGGAFLLSLVIRGIAKVVSLVKPISDESSDPDQDEAIQNVLKWKRLNEQGIISNEEFEEKRRRLLDIRGPKESVIDKKVELKTK